MMILKRNKQTNASKTKSQQQTHEASYLIKKKTSVQDKTNSERVIKPHQIKHTIAIASAKGGVGKSTVTAQLAMLLAKQGHAVGVIDADIYGPSQAIMFGANDQKITMFSDNLISPLHAHGVYFISASAVMKTETAIIWRAPMVIKLLKDFLNRVAWPELDYLLIDLPPGTGDIQISLTQQAKLSAAIIVTTPQQIATRISEKAIQMFDRVKIPILGIIENMSLHRCEHCGQPNPIFQQGNSEKLSTKYGIPCLARIPFDRHIVSCGDQGQALFSIAAKSDANQALVQLAQNLPIQLQQLDKQLDEPTHIDIHKGQLKLQWQAGQQLLSSPYQLRLHCRCAQCIDEHSGQKLLATNSIPTDISLTAIYPIGRYGLKLTFSDGHNTGIYTFDYLKKMVSLPTEKKP